LREDVVALLEAFGVTGAADDPLLDFIIATVTERIKNETNQPAIPEGLNRLAVEMVAGQYLSLKKGSGQLEGFDLEAAVKQIQEGDTLIAYAQDRGIDLTGVPNNKGKILAAIRAVEPLPTPEEEQGGE